MFEIPAFKYLGYPVCILPVTHSSPRAIAPDDSHVDNEEINACIAEVSNGVLWN